MINILGFVTLPASNQPYSVVAQPEKQYGVQFPAGVKLGNVPVPVGSWVSIQPDGSVSFRPPNWVLGGYELFTLIPGGLRVTPIDGASYLLAAVDV